MRYKKYVSKKFLVIMAFVSIFFGEMIFEQQVDAAVSLSSSPNVKVEYNYSGGVSQGTIRYVGQNSGGQYFHSEYWGSIVGSASWQCNLSVISMALSYVGVDRTPAALGLFCAPQDNFGAAKYSQPASVSSAVDSLINGKGQYSPVIIHIKPYPSSGGEHWLLVSGRVSSNTYEIVEPWNGSRTTYTTTILGSQININNNYYPIDTIVQYCSGTPTPTPTPTPGVEPIGNLDAIEGRQGSVYVYGWTVDEDNLAAALNVHVYVGDTARQGTTAAVTAISANQPRNDFYQNLSNVAAVSINHGYGAEVTAGDKTGWQNVYIYAINDGTNGNYRNPLIGQGKVYIAPKKSYCKKPGVEFADEAGGKKVTITAGDAAETVNYSITKDGKAYKSGSFTGSYSLSIKESGNYSVSAFATRANYEQSDTATMSKTVSQVVVALVNQCATDDGMLINISSSTDGASLYYTTSGNVPTVSSTKYTGPFSINTEKTIKVLAVKNGYVDSEIATSTVKMEAPEAPTGFAMSSDAQIPVGNQVSVSWNEDTMSSSHTVMLYKDGTRVSQETVKGNSAILVPKDPGKYQLKLYATNFVGNSEEASEVIEVEAMAPVTVDFNDWDGTVIKSETVTWGKDASLPADPERRGYTFSSWENADKITGVKTDLVVTALYKIKTYLIRFYDASGKQIGSTQRVEFGSSAVSPESDLTDIPTGYVFAGWRITESDNDCSGDYKNVDGDMKLQAVYCWENNDIPTVCEITDAKRNSETGNYNITFRITNYPEQSTTAMARVSLLTESGKLVKSGKIEVEIGADKSAEKTMTLKYSGTAVKASVVILGMNGDDLTDSANSRIVEHAIEEQAGYAWDAWGDWTDEEITATEEVGVETKTQYRYADKAYTSSTSSNMSGWTLYNTETVYGDWGGWYGWIEQQAPAASDTCQVEVSKFWRYYYLRCPNCGREEGLYGTSDCGWKSINSSHMVVGWSRTPYSQTGYSIYKDAAWKGVTDSSRLMQEGIAGYNGISAGHTWYFNAPDEGKQDVGAISGDSNDIIIRAFSRWRTRGKSLKYHFYKWGNFSEWSDTEITATDDRKVETRTLYRKRDRIPAYEPIKPGPDEEDNIYSFSGTIDIAADLNGKLATIMVYKGKNIDPNEDQIQYVGQTTIGEGNSYSFTVNLKSKPTALTGDFTVCLGIEGSTGLVNIATIFAPKTVYKVTYADNDGKELSVQEIEEGGNAKAPDSPKKTGYRFTGWDNNAINVQSDMTITAQYEPMEYVVTFIDDIAQVNTFNVYHYGDEIVPPDAVDAEGYIFKGWDAILDGNNIVTDNIVVHAVYEKKTFTVEFVNEKDEVISSQKVAYENAATPPAALDVAGKEFLGWSSENEWWNVRNDMTVKPILVYMLTAEAPSWYARQWNDTVDIYLETPTEGAKIYFTLDGSEPTEESPIYEDGISLGYTVESEEKESTSRVFEANIKAVAIAEDMNSSEVVPIEYSKTVEIVPEEVTRCLVTLDTNGGTELSDKILNLLIGEVYGKLPTPERAEYNFVGWYTEQESGTQINSDTIMTETEDHTLYAHWAKKSVEDPCANGHTEEIRNAKPATTTEEGYTGDTYCSVCGTLIKEGTVIPIIQINENAPTVSVGTVKGQVGKEVTVPVTITKNSGIAGFSFDVNYDSTKLTLKSMTAGEVLTAGSVSTNLNVVNWYTTDNIAVDGTVLNLTFEIVADAAAGQIPVSVALHDGKKNLVDENGVYVEANYQAGYVEAVKGLLGDMNGDDDLTIADVVLLNKHVLNKATLDVDRLALADVNKDGDITIGDVVILNRCVLGKISLQAEAKSVGETDPLSLQARALNAMSVTADDVTIQPGEKISIPIRVKGNTGFAGLAFSVNVPQGYTLDSITAGEMLAAGTFSTNENNCTWYTTDNISSDGILMTLNLTAGADAKTARISVTVKDGKANNLADENGLTVPVEFTAGTITVDTKTECEKNGHTEVKDEAIAATCTSPGKTEGSHCSACGEIIKAQETVPALGHEWGEGVVTKPATCNEYGVKTYTCSACHGTKTEFIEKTAHTVVKDEAVAATCTEPGKTEGSHCSVCNEVSKAQEEIPALGHDWNEGTVTKPASCSEEGVRTYTCSRCSETKTEVIAKTAHTEVKDEAVAANCTEAGKTEGSHCSVCNEVIKAQEEVPALGHDWDEGTVTTPATCTEEGSMTYSCSRCDETKTEVIPAAGHKWSDWKVTKAATYDQAGSKERICSVCNEKETEVIPKLVRTSITKASVSGITSKAYTGKAQTQSSLVVKVAGKTLKNGTDYSIAYKNNINIGKASLVITGKGIYTGSLTKTFNINVIKGKTYVVNGMKYQMTNAATNGSGTVTLTGTILGKDKVKTLTVADNVKIGNKYFAVTAIGNGAFKNYTKLTKLTIGKKVKTIGKDSFSGCKALKNIDIKTKNLTGIGKNAFKNINKKAKLKVPSGKKNAYMKMFKKSTNIKIS